MSDWEYWDEEQEQDALHRDTDPHRRDVSCFLYDKDLEEVIEEEVWSWHPGHRVLGWFTRLYTELQIGNEVFFASSIAPAEDDSSPTLSTNKETMREINGIIYHIVPTEKVAQYEVITIMQRDRKRIQHQADRLKLPTGDMKEAYFTEMLEEIAAFMKEHSTIQSCVFFRQI